MIKFNVITLFPELFPGPLAASVTGRAMGKLWQMEAINLRDFALDKHKKVDDSPYGGGPGMLLKADVMGEAIDYALAKNLGTKLLLTSARGIEFTQKKAIELSHLQNITIICGRYEGIDERISHYYGKNHGLEEISIGKYVISGGEISSFVIIDACLRNINGVLGNQSSSLEDSFSSLFGVESEGSLEFPQYTRPQEWRGLEVPEVILSGNHLEIERWRKNLSKKL